MNTSQRSLFELFVCKFNLRVNQVTVSGFKEFFFKAHGVDLIEDLMICQRKQNH